MHLSHFLTLSLALLFPVSHANAQEADTPPQAVEIKAVRERLVPYKDSYEMAKKLQQASNGHVALGVHLMPTKADVRMDDIRIWLESDEKSIAIKMREGSIFMVPVDDQIAAEKGNYSVNKKKGDLSAAIVILPGVPENEWTIGLMKQVIGEANVAIKKTTPWYLMPLIVSVKSVAVCSKQPNVNVQIMDGVTVIATVATKTAAKNDSGEPVFCAFFDSHTEYADGLHVSVPESAEVLLL